MPDSVRTNGPLICRRKEIRPKEGANPIFGSSALIRHWMAWPRRKTSSWPREPLPGGDLVHLPDDVEPGDHLGDRVLHLDRVFTSRA
jgi:hypothetical protein